MRKRYSLRKCKKIFASAKTRCKRRSYDLTTEQKNLLLENLRNLKESIDSKARENASKFAKELEQRCDAWIPRTNYERVLQAFMFVLIVASAICIRQMWFELYTIPTGSMRPTLKESDNLLVIKDPYGMNLPTRRGHITFEEDKLKHGNVVVLTSDQLDTPNSDTMYFGIIPGKKQFVKRLVGKAGDTLYFHGGKIYGIDRNGKPITAFEGKSFNTLEHIPYIYLEGKVKTGSKAPMQGVFPSSTFYQMNQPVAKVSLTGYGQVNGKLIGDYKHLEDFYQLWGQEHYAKARILTQEQLSKNTEHLDTGSDYYLEIFHHPSIDTPELKRDFYQRFRPSLHVARSIIPVSQTHLDAIFDNLTTARFEVKDGFVVRYGSDYNSYKNAGFLPKLPIDLEDGMYEFQDGQAYSVGIRGYTTKLDKTHPIYSHNPEYIQLMYNLGYEFNNLFSPITKDTTYLPSRYVYFRNGDLYAMNHPIILKDDKALTTFIEKEKEANTPFIPTDLPFIKEDGSYDVEFFKTYGLKIPEKMYLVLGDNHSMSGDSRDFGFVPEENLRGGASFIFSPPSERWGFIDQPAWEVKVFSRIFFWTFGSIALVIYFFNRRRKKDDLNYIFLDSAVTSL